MAIRDLPASVITAKLIYGSTEKRCYSVSSYDGPVSTSPPLAIVYGDEFKRSTAFVISMSITKICQYGSLTVAYEKSQDQYVYQRLDFTTQKEHVYRPLDTCHTSVCVLALGDAPKHDKFFFGLSWSGFISGALSLQQSPTIRKQWTHN